MLAAMRRDGLRVMTVVLRDRQDAARLGELRAPLALVDTIAASLAAPHLARLRARGSEVVTLAHMRPGAMALARRADRVIAVSRWLASELVVDAIVQPDDLRSELVRRFAAARGKDRWFSKRRHGVPPV